MCFHWRKATVIWSVYIISIRCIFAKPGRPEVCSLVPFSARELPKPLTNRCRLLHALQCNHKIL